MRGFKLNSRKLSVRLKLLGVFSVFSNANIFRLLKMNKKKVKMNNANDYKLKSNSFYAEAIKDCLDFIKRNSLSERVFVDNQLHEYLSTFSTYFHFKTTILSFFISDLCLLLFSNFSMTFPREKQIIIKLHLMWYTLLLF